MKKYIFYIAAIAMAVGCNDMVEELDNSLDTQTQEGDTFVTLKLTMEQPDTQTRVEVNEQWESLWEDGDIIYLLSEDSDIYSSMNYDDSDDTFSGTLNSGSTYRIYYTGGTEIIKFTTEDDKKVMINVVNSSLDPKMVSSETITISSDIDELYLEQLEQQYELFMQNITAAVTLDLTFDLESLFGSDYVNYTTLTIGDLTLGGEEVGETQFPTQSYVYLNKDIDDAEFYVDDPQFQSYNETLVGTGATVTAAAQSKYSIMLHSLPFTIKSGESLPIMFYAELSDDAGNTLKAIVQDNIYNTTAADFEIERSKYYTLSKSISKTIEFAGGDGSEDAPYQIATELQLANLAIITNNGETTSGVYYELTDDIDLAGYNWTPIGNSSSTPFSGNINGNDHTISNLTSSTAEENDIGLFGYISGANISNIIISKPSISGGYAYIGGVVGNCDNSTVTSCSVLGGSISGYNVIGGVVGYNNSSSTVTDCYNTSSVLDGGNIGGVVGYNNSSTVKDCYNAGSVKGSDGSDNVGGVVGYNHSSSTVTECYNTGSVTGKGSYTGGVVGNNYSKSTVSSCYNTGSVEGSDYVGGVVGNNINSGSTVSSCYNTASVKGTGNNVGGVVGYNANNVIACYNTGSVEGSDYVGGVVGYNANSSYVMTACYNTGSVKGGVGSDNVGGVAGYNHYSITYCYYIDSASSGVGVSYAGEGNSGTPSYISPAITAVYSFNTLSVLNGYVDAMNSEANTAIKTT
ncbi:MAG: GLUG motif-containing protein, partial [Rikenellaceae bacterium]